MVKKLNLFKSLNIEADEVAPVMLLIIQSVFIGIFYGAFDIGAHTLFLKTYPEDMIPKAYIVSGVVGIFLTSIFSRYQSRIKFSQLANRTLLAISAITILMRVFFEFTEASWTVFLVFILLGPLNILAILAFWGTVGRIFNLRQGKRLFGIIDSGQVFGIIISSFAIPIIITYIQGTKNLLVICAISIIFAMLLEIIISKRYKIDVTDTSENEAENESESEIEHEQVKAKQFIKDPYIAFMALFVIFSMFAAFFVQYSFLVVTNEQYPLEEDLASYLGFFTGSMMAFTLIIKTFVYSKLMKTYGLKVSLMLSSLLLILFTGIAIGIGFISGFEKASPGFIYFFLFISMGKLFNKTLKDALEVPAFKLLYQSLKKSIRFDVQAKIDGTINEIAALTSGLLLGALSILSFIELIHFSVFLFVLLVAWAFITIKLYKEYRNSLEQALQQNIHEEDLEKVDPVISQFKTLLSDPVRFSTKLNHIKSFLPDKYIETLIKISENFTPQEITFLSRCHWIELNLLYLQNQTPANWIAYFEQKYNGNTLNSPTVKNLDALFNSDSLKDVNSAIQHLANKQDNRHLTLISGLLRVPNIRTQQTTIRVCGTLAEIESINTLVEFLDSQILFPASFISLLQMGEKSIPYLIQMFFKTDISLVTQLSLIHIVGHYKTNESIDFLLKNISHHRKEIRKKSTECLKKLNYQPKEEELPKMFHPVTKAAEKVAWDISALASLGSDFEENHPLHKAINYEFEFHQSELIDLLSITYDSTSVKHVQDYLATETTEGISYGLELFDLFLSEEIKPMILALYEDLPLVEKTRLLENYFPVEVVKKEQLLLNIINRDPNLVSKETKRTALIEYAQISNKITNDIIAQLFNPITELQKTAALIINKIEPNRISAVKPRLSTTLKSKLGIGSTSIDQIDSAYKIDSAIINTFSVNKQQVSALLDYLSMPDTKSKGLLKNNLTEYFVFLIRNQTGTEESYNYNLYIDANFNSDEIELNKVNYIIGIKKEQMNQLVLTNDEIVQELINKIT